jgi:hypothetical protein
LPTAADTKAIPGTQPRSPPDSGFRLFEFTEYPDESLWVLLTSEQLPSKDPGPTFLPVPDINENNDFAPMSFTAINSFIRANEEALRSIDVSSGN